MLTNLRDHVPRAGSRPGIVGIVRGATASFRVEKRSGGYGCNGVLPGAPEGANLISGAAGGVPGFSVAPAPIYGGPVKALPANSRLSFGDVSCGSDGTLTSCVDSRNQAGFVVSPTASWVVNEVNPLLARPEGTNPYFN